jgi:hypothetical protein
LEHGELLAESEDFQGGIGCRADEDAKCNQDIRKELYHEPTVVARRGAGLLSSRGLLKPLISRL